MVVDRAQALPMVFAVLTLVGSLSLTVVHGIARGKTRAFQKWIWSDKLIPMAFLAAVPFWGLLFAGLSHGLGASIRSLDDGSNRIVAETSSWYHVPRLVCMGLTNCSAACFIHSLTGHIPGWKKASLASFFVMALWTVVAPMVALIGCTSDDANVKSSCPTMGLRWRAIMVLSVCLNVLLTSLAGFIPWIAEKLPRSDRLRVSILFLCRLTVPIFEICRYFAFEAFLEDGKPSTGLASTIVWDCVLVLASILTVALPAIKQLAKGNLSSMGRGSHGRSNATLDQRQSQRDLEAQVSAGQALELPKASIDLPPRRSAAFPPQPPQRSISRPPTRASSSLGLELDEYDYGLRGMQSYDSIHRILEAKPAD